MSFIKNYPKLSALALLLLSHSVFAAQECLFDDTYGIDLNFDTVPQVYDPTEWVAPTGAGFVPVVENIRVTPTHPVYSKCNVGNDGQMLETKTIAEIDLTQYYTDVGTNKKYVMFPTTRRGLYYGVRIKNQVGSPSICEKATGYLPPNQSYVDLYDVGDDYETDCFDNDTAWGFYVSYFIDKNFRHIPEEEDEGEVWDVDGSFKSTIILSHGAFRLSGASDDVKDNPVVVNYIAIEGLLKAE